MFRDRDVHSWRIVLVLIEFGGERRNKCGFSNAQRNTTSWRDNVDDARYSTHRNCSLREIMSHQP